MKTVSVAIVINSFNRLQLLKQCLKSLESWVPGAVDWFNPHVFIYDAGSTDGTMDWLNGGNSTEHSFPIKIIDGKNDDDTSFSAGLNHGVAEAFGEMPKLDYLLLYETDNQILSAEPVSQAITCLERDSNLAACGFTVRYLDGDPAGTGMPFPKVSHFLLGKKLSHKLKLERVRYDWKTLDSTQFSRVDVVFTSPLMVRPSAWRASGGLDAQMFPFSDCDIDWAKRLSRLGWHMGVVRTDAVIHDNSAAISSWSTNRALHFHRGRLRYFKRYNPIRIALVWPHFLALRHLLEYLLVACFIWNKERRSHLLAQSKRLMFQVSNAYQEEK
ncbi:MAG TPA: glycosyltransferase [Opitutales bacterium]|nr:glycosyltransferase [Opitutales bacterium]